MPGAADARVHAARQRLRHLTRPPHRDARGNGDAELLIQAFLAGLESGRGAGPRLSPRILTLVLTLLERRG